MKNEKIYDSNCMNKHNAFVLKRTNMIMSHLFLRAVTQLFKIRGGNVTLGNES